MRNKWLEFNIKMSRQQRKQKPEKRLVENVVNYKITAAFIYLTLRQMRHPIKIVYILMSSRTKFRYNFALLRTALQFFYYGTPHILNNGAIRRRTRNSDAPYIRLSSCVYFKQTLYC